MTKPLLEVKNISKTYGKQIVLDNLSFQIAKGQKIALIGRNGAGKSTILKILLNEITQDAGKINIFSWTQIGAVHQNEILPNNKSSLAYLEEVSGKPFWEVQKLGAKFGLHATHLDKVPSKLSGGYQMRVKLVAMFLQNPNLLFLDEPINYLDLQTLLLLETVLAEYKGSFILVAHDRTFLENTCDIVYEIECGKLTIYNGKVQAFLKWKNEQIEFSRRTNKKLIKEMKHHQKFVDRFGAKASLASRAQNKIKHISKLRSKITKIDTNLATTQISITSKPTHPGTALNVENLTIGYSPYIIAENISFTIQRGEKIVIVGENGHGKSTLLKTLIDKIELLDGNIKWWKHADIGYYDQLTDKSLNNNDTVLSHLTKNAPSSTYSERILMIAGNFLFRNDDLDKKVSVLSGGERSRLALAAVLLRNHNVLVLDEPTNHMDVETSDGLALALNKYDGTVIFVSHARTFVSTLVDRILEIKYGSIKEYLGTYDEYVEYQIALMAEDSKTVANETLKQDNFKTSDNFKHKENYIQIKKLQRFIRKLDIKIVELENKKSEILKFFFDNPTDYSPPKAQLLEKTKKELDLLEKQWIETSEKIEDLRYI